jgi:hypothetical protein
MYCGSVMCNDEALNAVLSTINANIHVLYTWIYMKYIFICYAHSKYAGAALFSS